MIKTRSSVEVQGWDNYVYLWGEVKDVIVRFIMLTTALRDKAMGWIVDLTILRYTRLSELSRTIERDRGGKWKNAPTVSVKSHISWRAKDSGGLAQW